ncbi:carboxymuconolactone decarboxylase family protein [Nocardia sp. NBC_00565]|uniref:carboxymuconolactone decarboxylase family protein n=1 Tax=Nocardia sp. NBC_00565 TaxID=2975993 RepID=UPI002E80F661|nr:carboxymuconolactone decarboxylase family protein [Nocardia sp. NBC_00565]WUC06262.1 carboxymuconolactone decarboxylase family protein [Nocardia sp. NBC_00565]
MRLPPLPADQWDDEVQRSLAGILARERQNPEEAGNVLATLVRHPALAKAFFGLGVHLLFRSTLPPRVRELTIMRVAHRRGCTYEWNHHLEFAAQAGLTEDDIASIQRGTAPDEFDNLVLSAADELDDKSNLSDQTWAALGERLNERQCMDLVFTVGCYCMLAMAFNTFGVEVEH